MDLNPTTSPQLPEAPSIQEHIQDLHRTITILGEKQNVLNIRVNKLENMLGVCFDEPTSDLDIKQLPFRNY